MAILVDEMGRKKKRKTLTFSEDRLTVLTTINVYEFQSFVDTSIKCVFDSNRIFRRYGLLFVILKNDLSFLNFAVRKKLIVYL